MELNSLPSDCLLLCFVLFPVHVQAQLRAVCTQWKWLIEKAWRKVKMIGIHHDPSFEFDYISFDNNGVMSSKIGSGLERFVTSERFPGVTSMNLNFFSATEEVGKSLMSHCLAQWTLTDLKLHFPKESYASRDHEFHSTIWAQIDSMNSLKSLYLQFSNLFRDEIAWNIPDNLSILNNLEKFILHDRVNDETRALTQLGPNLKQLELHVASPRSTQIFNSIAPKLISLRELLIEVQQFPQPYLLDLLTSLAQLNQLNKLDLSFIDWDQFISLVTHTKGYPKLTSVKHLSMNIYNDIEPNENPHQHMELFDRYFFTCIPIMFPSLETIEVEMFGQEDQQFVDMIKNRMKLKFVLLREGKFWLRTYPS